MVLQWLSDKSVVQRYFLELGIIMDISRVLYSHYQLESPQTKFSSSICSRYSSASLSAFFGVVEWISRCLAIEGIKILLLSIIFCGSVHHRYLGSVLFVSLFFSLLVMFSLPKTVFGGVEFCYPAHGYIWFVLVQEHILYICCFFVMSLLFLNSITHVTGDYFVSLLFY